MATAAHHQDVMLKVAQTMPLGYLGHQLLVLKKYYSKDICISHVQEYKD